MHVHRGTEKAYRGVVSTEGSLTPLALWRGRCNREEWRRVSRRGELLPLAGNLLKLQPLHSTLAFPICRLNTLAFSRESAS